jgi:hypothetical protein
MGEHTIKILDYSVDRCPKCSKKHKYKLKAFLSVEEEKIPLFGGPGGGSEIFFTCPNTKEKFTSLVPNPPNGEIAGQATEEDIALAESAPPAPTVPPSTSPVEIEFIEWIKSSRTTAIDFCKIMLTSSTGAIPIFFAVLKYIGLEKINTAYLDKVGILPPIMFLIAAIFFVLALRPRYEAIEQKDFAAFRARRLTQMNRFITAGTFTFHSAIIFAIVLFFYVLNQ